MDRRSEEMISCFSVMITIEMNECEIKSGERESKISIVSLEMFVG